MHSSIAELEHIVIGTDTDAAAKSMQKQGYNEAPSDVNKSLDVCTCHG